MILQILSIRDIKANVFMTPYFSLNIGSAIRGFEDEVNTPREGNMLNRHPQDFELFHLGTFADGECKFELLERPMQLVTGSSCVKSTK